MRILPDTRASLLASCQGEEKLNTDDEQAISLLLILRGWFRLQPPTIYPLLRYHISTSRTLGAPGASTTARSAPTISTPTPPTNMPSPGWAATPLAMTPMAIKRVVRSAAPAR